MARGCDVPEVAPARKSKELVLASFHNASVPLFDVVIAEKVKERMNRHETRLVLSRSAKLHRLSCKDGGSHGNIAKLAGLPRNKVRVIRAFALE